MRALALLLVAGVLTACRVDATVELAVEPDGSGTVTVEAIADAELVSRVPGIAEDLRVDDLVRAGWTVDGPEPTATGGLRIAAVHDFATVAEAEALLASLNGPAGPLVGITVTRTTGPTRAEVLLAGTLRISDGVEAFADSQMVSALGGMPFADELSQVGDDLSGILGIDVSARLPGEVTAGSGTRQGSTVTWSVPLDGSAQVIQASGVRSRDDGRWWRLGATVALVALVAWIVVAASFLLYVIVARRRALRRIDPSPPP